MQRRYDHSPSRRPSRRPSSSSEPTRDARAQSSRRTSSSQRSRAQSGCSHAPEGARRATPRQQAPSSSARRPAPAAASRRRAPSAPPRRLSRLALIAVPIVVIVILILLIRLFACSGDEPAAQDSPAVDSQVAASSSASSASAPASATLTANMQNRTAASMSANDVRPTEKVVYLTFDDGPSEHTEQILDTLDDYGIKATWFVIGNTGNLDKVTEIWERGHQVGLHTSEHDYEYVYANPGNFVADINAIGAAVQERLGFMPTLIRYPGGSVNGYNAGRASEFIQAAADNGWHYFDWNVSIGDSTQPPAPVEALVDNIMREAEGCNSCCVLMHDSDFKPTTPEALPQVIEYFLAQGYSFDVLAADSFGYHF